MIDVRSTRQATTFQLGGRSSKLLSNRARMEIFQGCSLYSVSDQGLFLGDTVKIVASLSSGEALFASVAV